MPLTFRTAFTSRIETCPANPRQENQCVGRFAIWAYLIVDGTIELPGTTPNTVTTHQVSGKILGQKAIVPFSVDFSDTIGTSDTVHTCMEPVGIAAQGRSQYTVNESIAPGFVASMKIESVGVPVTTSREQNDCISGKATFKWQCGVITVQAVINASAITTALPIAGPVGLGTSGTAGATALGIPIPPLEVVYEVCYRDGCLKQTIPDDTASDGDQVFLSPPTKLTVTPP